MTIQAPSRCRKRQRQPAWRVVVMALMVTVTMWVVGACSVSTPVSSDRTDGPGAAPGIDTFRKTLRVDYDLRTPPVSPQQLGVKPGRDSAIFDRDGEYWTARFLLPDGSVFETDRVFGVSVSFDAFPDDKGALNNVSVQMRAVDVPDLRRRLRAQAELMGVGEVYLTGFLRDVELRPPTINSGPLSSGLGGRDIGYLSVGAGAKVEYLYGDGMSPTITYEFTWDAAASTPGATSTEPRVQPSSVTYDFTWPATVSSRAPSATARRSSRSPSSGPSPLSPTREAA